MRDDPQGGSSAHVALKAPCRRVVHSPDTGRAVDLWAGSLTQHLAGAGHDAAELTVQLQGLEERKQVSNKILYQSIKVNYLYRTFLKNYYYYLHSRVRLEHSVSKSLMA